MKLYDNIGSTPSRSTMIIKPLNISGFCFFKALILSPFYQSVPSEKLYKNLKFYSDRAVLYYCPMQ